MPVKKKQTKADFLRSWGIETPPYQYGNLRYKNPPEKGVYWYYFSLYVRQRDVERWGTCISCGKPITVDTCQAGHFIAAHGCGRDLLFDPLNVNAECPGCNGKDQNHLWGYEKNLINRHGAEVPSMLKLRYFEYKNSDVPIRDWKASEYAAKIKLLPSYTHATIHDDVHT